MDTISFTDFYRDLFSMKPKLLLSTFLKIRSNIPEIVDEYCIIQFLYSINLPFIFSFPIQILTESFWLVTLICKRELGISKIQNQLTLNNIWFISDKMVMVFYLFNQMEHLIHILILS